PGPRDAGPEAAWLLRSRPGRQELQGLVVARPPWPGAQLGSRARRVGAFLNDARLHGVVIQAGDLTPPCEVAPFGAHKPRTPFPPVYPNRRPSISLAWARIAHSTCHAPDRESLDRLCLMASLLAHTRHPGETRHFPNGADPRHVSPCLPSGPASCSPR